MYVCFRHSLLTCGLAALSLFQWDNRQAAGRRQVALALRQATPQPRRRWAWWTRASSFDHVGGGHSGRMSAAMTRRSSWVP